MRLSLCLALAILLAQTAFAETRRQAGAPDPCAAATAPANYGRLLQVPDPLKAEVEAYRQGWKDACTRKGASLAALLARGDRIGKDFAAVVDKSGMKETMLGAIGLLALDRWRSQRPR